MYSTCEAEPTQWNKRSKGNSLLYHSLAILTHGNIENKGSARWGPTCIMALWRVTSRLNFLSDEGDQMLGAASLATHTRKAMLQPPVIEVILELALYIARQFPAPLR